MSKSQTDKKELTEQEKLRYLQKKIHEATLKCMDSYLLLKKEIPLIQASLALVFMDFRNSIATSISMPFRYKSSQSVQKNINNEFKKNIKLLPENCTTEDIDKMVESTIESISKDFFGATFVLHNQNDVRNYCNDSDDPYVRKLFDQYLCVENYLNKSKKIQQLPEKEKKLQELKKIDISDTFIDEDANSHAPHAIFPFSADNIKSYRDYNTKLIELLTLSANCSMPCTDEKDSKTHKYAVSQKDISYLRLVEEARMRNPKDEIEWIQILTELAHKAYFEDYIPFDVQLENAIEENRKLSYLADYDAPLTEAERIHYINHLTLLAENLEMISKDRLLNYILKKEMPNILKDLLQPERPLTVEILDKKEKAKENGFYALYYILRINNIAKLELQAQSEYRSDLAKEGNAAHNTIPGKSFDIRHMFELDKKNAHPFDPTQLDFYCDFLETVNLNDIAKYRVPKKDLENLKILQHLVEYASSKIKVKGKIPNPNTKSSKKMDFYSYIKYLLEYYGPEFGSIVPAHRIEHNQALVVPQNNMYALENILKNRVGFSVLANLIRLKYKEEASKKRDELLPTEVARAYSDTLINFDFYIKNDQLREDIKKFSPSKDIPFTPMDGNKQENASR